MNATAYLRSAAIAGVTSAIVFALVHQFLISDIWYSLPVMAIAGAICGVAVAWTYALLFPSPSLITWLTYNAVYLVMFVLLGVASLLVFEPITTMAAVIEANEPPAELIGKALPMTVAFTLITAALLSLLYSRTWPHFGALLLSCSTLVLLLGLNISVIGLVDIPLGSAYLVAELLALVAVLNLAYVAVFVALERKRLSNPRPIITVPALER